MRGVYWVWVGACAGAAGGASGFFVKPPKRPLICLAASPTALMGAAMEVAWLVPLTSAWWIFASNLQPVVLASCGVLQLLCTAELAGVDAGIGAAVGAAAPAAAAAGAAAGAAAAGGVAAVAGAAAVLRGAAAAFVPTGALAAAAGAAPPTAVTGMPASTCVPSCN
jgi:hypothetical protein